MAGLQSLPALTTIELQQGLDVSPMKSRRYRDLTTDCALASAIKEGVPTNLPRTPLSSAFARSARSGGQIRALPREAHGALVSRGSRLSLGGSSILTSRGGSGMSGGGGGGMSGASTPLGNDMGSLGGMSDMTPDFLDGDR